MLFTRDCGTGTSTSPLDTAPVPCEASDWKTSLKSAQIQPQSQSWRTVVWNILPQIHIDRLTDQTKRYKRTWMRKTEWDDVRRRWSDLTRKMAIGKQREGSWDILTYWPQKILPPTGSSHILIIMKPFWLQKSTVIKTPTRKTLSTQIEIHSTQLQCLWKKIGENKNGTKMKTEFQIRWQTDI